MHKDLLWFAVGENAKKSRQRIEEAIDNALLERNDGVVSDRNAFGTHLRTTLRDIAQTDSKLRSQILNSITHVQWVHFESSRINQKSWADELFLHVVLAQYVTDVLAEIAFDALAKFLHSFDILLGDTPSAIRSIRRPRLEFRDALFHFIIP